MKKTILITIILLLNTIFTFSQDIESELNGFKLRQYRDVTKTEFGKPFQVNKFDDGFEAEIYLIKSDSSAYMIFEYPNWNKNIIYSIQISGAFEDINPKFKGLKMGMSENELVKKVGKPTSSKNNGEYGKMLEYQNTNYSFEIDNNGKLASIKIVDNFDNLFPEPKVEKIPSFDKLKEILKSNNPKLISEILSPEMEISIAEKILYFEKSWEKEINTDNSLIFKTISELIEEIEKIDVTDEKQYEENMRLTLGENPKHVLKFKSGFKIKEIVLKWEAGKYVIWEIKT